MNQDTNKSNLKIFFIKLTAIALTIVIVISLIYNLIFADKLESLNKFLSLSNKENIEHMKNKVRIEIEKGINKEKLFNDEDKKLLYKFYLKIKEEFKGIE